MSQPCAVSVQELLPYIFRCHTALCAWCMLALLLPVIKIACHVSAGPHVAENTVALLTLTCYLSGLVLLSDHILFS